MENAVIYVAGDPEAYPVEYYDEQTGAYQGLIPALLERFGREQGYDVRYYEPDKGDQRQTLAEDRQVDIISDGGGGADFRHDAGGEVVLLETEQDGQSVVYKLLVTEVAPEGLADQLRSFLAGVEEQDRTGLLVQSARREKPVDTTLIQIGGAVAGALLVILAAVAVFMARHYRRRIRSMEMDRETDTVTGLGNRDYLERNCNTYINDQNKILYRLLYVFVDTDQLDKYFGRSVTDEYVRAVALALQEHTGDMDILSRVSDTGFVLLRLTMDDQDEQHWLKTVLDRIDGESPDKTSGEERYYAVGSYQIRPTDRDLYGMIFDASQCAQSAYLDGEVFRACTDEVIRNLAVERQFREDMRRGLDSGEFLLYLQFYVDSATGDIVGGEALSRWDHPGRGLLMPGDFLPMMEREHLVPQLDYRCLENACVFLQDMYKQGRERFFVSCNFAKETFSDPAFPEECRKVVRKYGFPVKWLVFELKETGTDREIEQIRENIRRVKELGVTVALDDFGELFASFADVEDIPLDIVKISRRLVEGIGSKSGESVMRGMIRVSRELGFGVMAEGVESEEQADFLRREGCEAMQGFLFYRPLPEWEARKIIVAGGKTHPEQKAVGTAP